MTDVRLQHRDSRLIVILALVAIAPYLNTLLNAFVYDDDTQVLSNPYLQNLHHLHAIFATTVWSYVGTQGVTNYYRPMMTLGYLLCYKLFGPLAYGFHLCNVALHAGIVCLLFFLTLRMSGSRTLAFIAASLFAVHPVHTESVAWIAAVTDLELTFFYLATFWFFLTMARPGGERSNWARAGMVVSFGLALLSKEQALTLPVLAMIYEHLYRNDRALTSRLQKLSRYGALWLMAAAYLLFRIRYFGALAPVTQMASLTWREAILSTVTLTGRYIAKLLWPAHLSAFYVFHKTASPLDPRFLAGLAVLALVAVLFLQLWRRDRIASFGILWFFVTLAPVLNARWMAANVFAERYLYLPSIGFCWVAAWFGARWWESAVRGARGAVPRRSGDGARTRLSAASIALAAGFAIVLALAAARIVLRNRDWRNDVILYTRTLAAEPDAYEIRNNLGTVYWKQGQVELAEREWRRAVKLAPSNAIILNNLALALSKQQKYDEAVPLFERAMRLKPNYTDPHLNLGSAYRAMGEAKLAERQLLEAVRLAPLNYAAHNELARLYLDEHRGADAENQFRLSADSQPNLPAFDGLAALYAESGDRARAAEAYRRALDIDAFDSQARFGLGAIYVAEGKTADARAQYQAGLESDPQNAAARAALKKLKP